MKFFLHNPNERARRRKLNNLSLRSKNNIFKSNASYKSNTKGVLNFFKIVLIIICISFGVYYFLFSPKFKIEKIRIKIDEKVYSDQKVTQQINAKYKGGNIFLTEKKLIEEDVKKLIGNISFIDIRKVPPSEIRITLQEFKEAANVSIKLNNVEKKYIINQNGQIGSENVFDENLPLIIIKSIKEPQEVVFSLKKEELDYILLSKKYFEEKFNILVDYVDYFEIEHEIHLITEKGFEVWLDIDQSYILQLHALKLATQKLDIFNTPLAYIDLRVANGQKIIFKRR